MRWFADEAEHRKQLEAGVATAAKAGAKIVFLPELTLSRYPADKHPAGPADATAESLRNGPTHRFTAQLARTYGLHVHASLFERSGAEDERGLNTAIMVSPDGALIAHTRKLHIPVTEGYFEDQYFAPGQDTIPYPVHSVNIGDSQLRLGLPTCWDEWFPEVPRCYALAGAELLAYPTAIGSEPDYPKFDTQPLLRQVVVGHAIANGLFIVLPNRVGAEGTIEFYGSSFIVDPFGRVLAEAPRDKEMVLVADIDLGQREDWLTLFPFFATRRPETYSLLSAPVVNPRTTGGAGIEGGIPGVTSRSLYSQE
jgi:N-carbamoylputrescine amidase